MEDLSKKGNYETRPFDDRTPAKKNKDSFFAALSYAILAGALLVALLFAYWTIQPSDVIEVKGQPSPVADVISKSEGRVIVPFDYCKKLPLEAKVTRSFVGESTQIFQPEATENAPTGCYKRDVPIIIPPQVVPGTYTIKYEATYEVNPIKTVTETFETEPFRIVE